MKRREKSEKGKEKRGKSERKYIPDWEDDEFPNLFKMSKVEKTYSVLTKKYDR